MNNSYDILEILLQCIQKNGITEKQCLIDCNINTSFFADWKGGRLKNPSYDKIVKLAKHLNIDLNLLFLGEKNNTQKSELSNDEQALISNYKKLNDEDKKEILKRAKELSEGIKHDIFKHVQYTNSREKEMLMLFKNLSEYEQAKLIGRAELLIEQDKIKENTG